MPKRKRKLKVYRKKSSLFSKILKGILITGFVFVILIFGLFFYFIKDLPRPEKFTESTIFQSTKIYDRTGKILLYEIAGKEKRTIVSEKEIPDYLKFAVIVAEDKNFFKHKGFDLKGIVRAILYDLKVKKFAQGGSTISQQLIRNYFLSKQKTLKRKTRELILALELERKYPKEKILTWYLNLVPFGGNLYGVESASQTFFGKHTSELSLAESAILAALVKAPSYYSPYGPHLDELIARQRYILEKMQQYGYISEKEKLNALNEKIKFLPKRTTIYAPHFVMFVKEYLEKKYGKEFLTQKGLKVQTTLDFQLQKTAEEILKTQIEKEKKYNAFNAGLVALDPKTGEILAMVGSKDYFGNPFPKGCTPGKNCLFDPKVNVTLSLRQPGSAFKPLSYTTAFLKGLTPETIVWDVKTEFNPLCPPTADKKFDKYHQKCYHPQNYDGKFLGPIKLKSALAQSRNVPSVKVLYLAGVKDTIQLAEEFGITTLKNPEKYGLSLVLGGGEVKLLEMVRAFSVFANDGYKTPLNFIKKIEDSQGNILEEEKIEKIKIIPSQIAREINYILSDNKLRAPMFGENSLLKIDGYEVAVKTGTTQEFRDAWTIGYTPSIVVGVWVGNNDNTPTTKPGVVLAAPIWHNFMKEFLKNHKKEVFKKPSKRVTNIPILDGILPKEKHCILYYIKKENPLSPPSDPFDDVQFFNWEKGVENYLKSQKSQD